MFLIAEFEKLQNQQPFEDVDGNQYEAIRRPIGEWNCMHIAMAFSTKYSKRQYTDAQLKKWADDNEKGCMIGGKHYTTYEAAQLMRQIETQVGLPVTMFSGENVRSGSITWQGSIRKLFKHQA